MGWSLCFQRLFPPVFPPPPPAGWHPPPRWPSPSCLVGGRGWRRWPGLGTHTQTHSYGHTQGHMGRHTQSRGHTPHTKSHIHSYSHAQSWMCSHPHTSQGRPPADILWPPHPRLRPSNPLPTPKPSFPPPPEPPICSWSPQCPEQVIPPSPTVGCTTVPDSLPLASPWQTPVPVHPPPDSSYPAPHPPPVLGPSALPTPHLS